MFPIFPWDLNSLTFFFPWVKLVFHYTGVQLLVAGDSWLCGLRNDVDVLDSFWMMTRE